jgi:hypothetical protein
MFQSEKIRPSSGAAARVSGDPGRCQRHACAAPRECALELWEIGFSD